MRKVEVRSTELGCITNLRVKERHRSKNDGDGNDEDEDGEKEQKEKDHERSIDSTKRRLLPPIRANLQIANLQVPRTCIDFAAKQR